MSKLGVEDFYHQFHNLHAQVDNDSGTQAPGGAECHVGPAMNWQRKPFASGGKVDHEPTEAQKSAGNYRKEHVSVQGLDISIENKKGSERSGVDAGGHRWRCVMPADYGYIKRTTGADGDHVDVYVGPDRESPVVFVINQCHHITGEFDEHKVMLGYRSERDALRAYEAAFSDGKGRDRCSSIETMSMDAFKAWLASGKTLRPARSRSIIDRALSITSGAAPRRS
jgi:hypothetical protein